MKTWGFDSSPYKAAGKYLIDDVIDPRDTRKFLSQTLEYACAKNGSKSERNLAMANRFLRLYTSSGKINSYYSRLKYHN
ncbi:hypothetical protein GCM10027286_02350 [Virgibacillus ainsalahensis]